MKNSKSQQITKIVRVVVWVFVAITIPIALSLEQNAKTSASYSDGTYLIKGKVGDVLLLVTVVMGSINLILGIVRWLSRWSDERWKLGKVIGKLIGGGIWRTLLIAPLVFLSFFFISKPIIQQVGQQKQDPPLAKKLDKVISSEEDLESMSRDELAELYGFLSFENVDFSEEKNVSFSEQKNFLSKNAYADPGNMKYLNKALLSKKRHFVVFYTDSGEYQISDGKAKELTQMLESLVDAYAETFSQPWSYEQSIVSDSAKEKAARIQKILKNNGIDENILETAMPVYVIDPNRPESNFSASCVSAANASLIKTVGRLLGYGNDAVRNTVSFPYIVIIPKTTNDESLKTMVAHELSHYYAERYCYREYGEACKGKDFVNEGSANYMAMKTAVQNFPDDFLNTHHRAYIGGGSCYPIDMVMADPNEAPFGSCRSKRQQLGYATFGFFTNYAEVVPNGKDIIFQSVHEKNSLKNLYEQSGYDNTLNQPTYFKKAMSNLTIRNITNDYPAEESSLITDLLPTGEKAPCSDSCEKTFAISRVSSQYFYFPTEEFDNREITFSSDWGVVGTILGQKRDGKWSIIDDSQIETGEALRDKSISYRISNSSEYNLIVLAITNFSYSNDGQYSLKVMNANLANLIELDEKGEMFKELGNGCYEINADSFLDLPLKLMNLGGGMIEFAANLDKENDYTAVKQQFNTDLETIEQQVETTKSELSKYRITICGNYLKKGTDFEEAKQTLQKALSAPITIYEDKEKNEKTSVFVGFDLNSRSGKIYSLMQNGKELGLLTMTITEKT